MIREYKAIAKNYFANVYGMGVTVANQILMVPVFINFWGVEKYGNWILITAFSSFFAMTNLGLNQATNNEFVISYQSKKYRKCNHLLVNSFFLIFLISLLIISITGIIAFNHGFKKILGVTIFTESETNSIFLLLVINVFTKMFGGIYNGVFRVRHQAHLNAIIENSVKLLETLILFLGLFFKLEIVFILVIYNLPALITILYKHVYTISYFKLEISKKEFDFPLLKSIVYPSMSFMLIPLSQALSNQGMIFVLNTILGPVVLVLYTTTRTLVNFIRSVVDLFGNAIYPEISIAWGKQNIHKIFKIFNPTIRLTLISTFISVLLLWFLGEKIFLFWTKNAVQFDEVFFKGMILVIIVLTLSKIFSILLLSTNNHNRYTIAFLIAQFLIVAGTYITMKYISFKISAIPLIIFLAEAILLIFTILEVNRVFNYNFKSIFKFNNK